MNETAPSSATTVGWFIKFVGMTLLFAVATTAIADTGQLTIRLVGFTSDEGTAAYAMWSGPDDWLGKEGTTVTDGFAPIVEGVSEIVIDALPFGEYAVSAYHDQNNNQQLDTRIFGIPKEPLGTSNDAKMRFGPPKYQDAKFQLEQDALTITITIKKLF
jgi:uncharacterized protein (DUF2141 family)